MTVLFAWKERTIMAKAYRCDLCGKYADDCYKVGGIDLYPSDLIKVVIDKSTKHEVSEICKQCYEKILGTVTEIYRNATTEQ